MANKPKNSKLVLTDNGEEVTFDLVDEYDISLFRRIFEMPHPRVRAPRQAKAKIDEMSKSMAPMMNQSQKEYLRKSIIGVNNEINLHIQEVRKELKRIQSLTHYVITAEEILSQLEDS